MTRVLVLIIFVILISFGFFLLKPAPVGEEQKAPSPQTIQTPQIIAKNLEIPWSLIFLPDKKILFTQRGGKVRLLEDSNAQTIFQLNDVAAIGEGGLLGIEIHPNFRSNNFVYIYYTYQKDNELFNKILRYKFQNNTLTEPKVILENIPGNNFHNGGRIQFGPDGNLYIGTGDSQNPSTSQNKNSLAGKILRVKDDESIPLDNPFSNAVYSYGHRNVQGLAWDNDGKLWATEHGSLAFDELNLIEKGKNYGWPDIRGDQKRTGMTRPVIHSGNDTWAPSGLAFFNGSLYFAGLKGETLYEFNIETLELKEHFKENYGRLRDVVLGPDEFLYILTSNTDGRGNPIRSDDRLLKIKF